MGEPARRWNLRRGNRTFVNVVKVAIIVVAMSTRTCARACGRIGSATDGVYLFFFSSYDLTNCVEMLMLTAELLSVTKESTWIPRRGRADVILGLRSLQPYFAPAA